MKEKINQFLNGKCEEILASFPENSVDFVLTSPPYADQRVYGTKEFTISPDLLILKLISSPLLIINNTSSILKLLFILF
jgi:hypothetical protein